MKVKELQSVRISREKQRRKHAFRRSLIREEKLKEMSGDEERISRKETDRQSRRNFAMTEIKESRKGRQCRNKATQGKRKRGGWTMKGRLEENIERKWNRVAGKLKGWKSEEEDFEGDKIWKMKTWKRVQN